MKCTTCGYETQPGAKFCVQCGTTLVAASAPAGMAPLAAPSLTPRPPAMSPNPSPSATAARPASTPSVPPPATSATGARPAYTPSAAIAGMPPAVPTPATSAAAPASSMRLGLIVGVLVLVAVLGVGFFVAYKMLFPPEPKETVTTTDSNKRADSPPAQPPMEAPKDAVDPPALPQLVRPTATRRRSKLRPRFPRPILPRQAPRRRLTRRRPLRCKRRPMPRRRRPFQPSPRRRRRRARRRPRPRRRSRRQRPRRRHHSRIAGNSCARPTRCARKESLFDRLACNHRVGQQYCKGYWGQVPQCPAGAYGDRGNN